MAQKYSLFIIIFALIAGCKQESTSFSIIPSISIKSIEQIKLNGKDSAINFVIAYTDGDGDIGLDESDTMPPFNEASKYYFNLEVNVYAIENGKASRIPIPSSTDSVSFNSRISNLTPTGKSKSISGDIKLIMRASPSFGVFPDSMMYTFRLYDRALHQSQLLKTPALRFVF